MRDWDLHADVTGAVGYDGSQWKWQPEVTIYLQWKAIPELEFKTTVEEDGQLRVQ